MHTYSIVEDSRNGTGYWAVISQTGHVSSRFEFDTLDNHERGRALVQAEAFRNMMQADEDARYDDRELVDHQDW